MCVKSLKIDAKILGIPEEFKGTGNIRRGNARSYRDYWSIERDFFLASKRCIQTEETCANLFRLGKLYSFTFVELLVVIAIIGILIGLSSTVRSERLQSETN